MMMCRDSVQSGEARSALFYFNALRIDIPTFFCQISMQKNYFKFYYAVPQKALLDKNFFRPPLEKFTKPHPEQFFNQPPF